MLAPPVPEIPLKFRFPKSTDGVEQSFVVASSGSSSTAYSPGPNHRSCPQRVARRLPRPIDLAPEGNFHRESIAFKVNGAFGIRLKDLLESDTLVDDGDVQMFANHSWRKTLFAIHWPGYNESSIPIRLKAKETDGRPITRQMLAVDIAQKLQAFMSPHTQRYAPRKGGSDDQWRIAKYDGHVFGDVTLTSMHLYKRVWVPDLYVEW
ncbi:hypothetical protein HWV62_18562 [Athelia sp. TMB]|nr:hypothetical protein HWV62_18562 [Athelia sp. TMB]